MERTQRKNRLRRRPSSILCPFIYLHMLKVKRCVRRPLICVIKLRNLQIEEALMFTV